MHHVYTFSYCFIYLLILYVTKYKTIISTTWFFVIQIWRPIKLSNISPIQGQHNKMYLGTSVILYKDHNIPTAKELATIYNNLNINLYIKNISHTLSKNSDQ